MTERQGVTTQQIFNMLMESQYWPPEQMQAYQRSQLEQLLRHAKANVPFYKTRLDCVFRNDGSIDWDRWEEIPIVTREDLRDRRDEMQATVLPQGHGVIDVFSSSGSTGLAVSVTHNYLESVAAEAARFRSHQCHDIDWSGRLCNRRRNSQTAADAVSDKLGWAPPWTETRGPLFALYDDIAPETACRFLVDNKIDYLFCRPSVAHAMALVTAKLGLQPRLRTIFTYGEETTEKMLQICDRYLGAQVVSLYSSTECYKIAHKCANSSNMHINSELMLVETVGREGLEVDPGQAGKVIVTPFLNTAQPLIRYDQGDTAVHAHKCTCGINLPVLSRIDGRTNHLFSLPDGRRLTVFLPTGFYDCLSTDVCQIAQVARSGFEVRYVPSGTPREGAFQFATDFLRSKLSLDISVAFKQLEPPGFDPTRKLIECVNEVGADD